RPRRGTNLHLTHRTLQLDASRPPPADDPAVERVQPQARQPAGGAGALLRLLQLLPDAQEHPHDSGDGGRNHAEGVDDGGSAGGCAGRSLKPGMLFGNLSSLRILGLPTTSTVTLSAKSFSAR